VLKWTRWYADARDEAAFRYGLRGIPKDDYKTEYALGNTPTQAAKNIYDRFRPLSAGEFRARTLDDAS
jgi:hypothetical protein